MNKIYIHGRLTKDPEVRTTQSGATVCNITVAADRRKFSAEERQTDFFDVALWNGLADVVSMYFRKGKEIIIHGEMQSRKWQDKDGNNRQAWNVVASEIEFCGPKDSGQSFQQIQPEQQSAMPVMQDIGSEPVPF